jgi:hypothetical protein
MSDIRDVSSLPIAAQLIDKLHAHGFRLVSDLQGVKPLDLAQEIGIAPALAMTVIRAASGCLSQSTQFSSASTAHPTNSASTTVFSAKDLVARMSIQRPIITFCKALDTMLGGGVSIGHVTEICGVPGIGKTQLLCQFALNVQIPEVFHGLGGETLFLDTEGTFFPERVAEMAHELSKHLMKMAQHTAAQRGSHAHHADLVRAQLQAAESMTMERFLTGIHVVRCHDTSDVHVFLHHLTAFLSLHPAVRLIVIDSIAFPFRAMGSISSAGGGGSGSGSGSGSVGGGGGVAGGASGSSGGGVAAFGGGSSSSSSSGSGYTAMERQRQLAALAQRLSEVAFQHNCAVVVSNHVTTRIAPTTASATATVAGTNVDIDSGKGRSFLFRVTDRPLLTGVV